MSSTSHHDTPARGRLPTAHAGSIPPPADRRPVPLRPHDRARPRGRHLRGADRRGGRGARARSRWWSSTPSTCRSTAAGSWGDGGDRIEVTGRVRRRDPTRARSPWPTPRRWGETLHLTFRGILNDQLHGFYRSTYTDDDGETHTIATTQFEAADARRAFPCWDEPDLKAVFGITLIVPDGPRRDLQRARGRARGPSGDGHVRVRFADTMVMSTYLVAFVVGRLGDQRAGRGRRRADPGRPPARQGPSHRVRAGRRGLLDPVLPRVLRHARTPTRRST